MAAMEQMPLMKSVVHETTSQIKGITNGRRKLRRRRIGRKLKNDVANNRFSGSSVMLLMILWIVDLTIILLFKASYEGQDDIELMRFTDYFGRAFSGVPASQFRCVKLLRESPLPGLQIIPCHIFLGGFTRRQWNGSTNNLLKPFLIFSSHT